MQNLPGHAHETRHGSNRVPQRSRSHKHRVGLQAFRRKENNCEEQEAV